MFEKLCKKNGGSIKVKDICEYLKTKVTYGNCTFIFAIFYANFIVLYTIGKDNYIELIKYLSIFLIKCICVAIILGIIVLIFYKIINTQMIKRMHTKISNLYIKTYTKIMNTTIIKCKLEDKQ